MNNYKNVRQVKKTPGLVAVWLLRTDYCYAVRYVHLSTLKSLADYTEL